MRAESFRTYPKLEGRFVRLVALDLAHRDPLAAAAQDPEVGRYILTAPGTTPGEMEAVIRTLLDRRAAGTDLPFTTIRVSDSVPVGMTRYLNIDRPNDAVEVGGTWLDRRLWRTPFNTESKYLLLTHAFETEGAHRVYLKTDVRNERSQRAIERLGAVREAVLREHIRLPDGQFRSSVFYGILASEWPKVKRGLEERLARPWTPSA